MAGVGGSSKNFTEMCRGKQMKENRRGLGEKLVSAVQKDIVRGAKKFTELVFNV